MATKCIERQDATIADLVKALEPFVRWLDGVERQGFAGETDHTIIAGRGDDYVTFGDLRRARAALEKARRV